MKRKALTLTILFLALIAIVSVGFASWIITRPVVDKQQNGSITAETVTDVTYQLNVEAYKSSSNVIHFGTPSDANAKKGSNSWLSNNGGQVENLQYDMALSVDKYENFAKDQIYANLYVSEGEKEIGNMAEETESKVFEAKTAGYIQGPNFVVNGVESAVAKNFEVLKTNFGLEVTYTTDGSNNKTEFKTVEEIKNLVNANSANASFSISVAYNGLNGDDTSKINIDEKSKQFISVTGRAFCVVSVQFKWGFTAKDGVHTVNSDYKVGTPLNPLIYYSYYSSDDQADAAMTALNAISQIFGTDEAPTNTTFKVIFSDQTK